MPWQTIKKSPESQQFCPNLSDYEQARTSFSWNQVRQELTGLPNEQGLNIAYEAVERHALGPRREQVALRWLGKNGSVQDYSYGRLLELTNRFANVLKSLGVDKGDKVFALAERIPESISPRSAP